MSVQTFIKQISALDHSKNFVEKLRDFCELAFCAYKRLLETVCKTAEAGGKVICHPLETDSYGRTVAQGEANGKDLSCALVEAGHAVERYGRLNCL